MRVQGLVQGFFVELLSLKKEKFRFHGLGVRGVRAQGRDEGFRSRDIVESRKLEHHHYPHWVVVKIMVPFWVLIIIRHLIFRVPKKGT